MFGGVFVVVLALLVSSCGSSSKAKKLRQLPPPAPQNMSRESFSARETFLDHYAQTNTTQEARWWVTYQQGLLFDRANKSKSCAAFTELSKSPTFPLFDVADLRRLLVCETTEEFNWERYLAVADRKPWLRELALDVTIRSVERHGHNAERIEGLLEKSKHARLKSEREEYLLRALDIAKEPGLEPLAVQIQKRLWTISPRLAPAGAPAMAVAEDFRSVRDYAQAKIHFRKAADESASAELKLKALSGLRMTAKLAQDKPAYLEHTLQMKKYAEENWKKSPKDAEATKLYLENSLIWIRALWTEGNNSLARKILLQTEKRLKGHAPLDEVYWILGRMADEEKNHVEAITYYEKATAEAKPSPQNDRIRWNLAWLKYKQKEYGKASELLNTLAATTTSAFDRAKYQYWWARSEKGQGRDASRILETLAIEDGLGYYGMLARRELKIAPPAGRKGDQSVVQATIFKNDAEWIFTEWLLAVGEQDIAESLLRTKADELNARKSSDRDSWYELLQYYARAGKYLDLFRYIGSVQPQKFRDELVLDHPELYFPRLFVDDVNAASRANNVPAELIYSIMRQESAFDTYARSPADALGLLQILPSVAKNYLDQNETFHAEDLFDPPTNIRIGGRLLKAQLARYQNNFILAVASYNASEKAVDMWIKMRHREDPIEFIEEIPYEETKGYVKLVMRNFVFYSHLNGIAAFPEWCLQPVQPSSH
jgi:soluble lytic murein transglycosylase